MSRRRWPDRRELVLADVVLLGAIAGLAIENLVKGPDLGALPSP